MYIRQRIHTRKNGEQRIGYGLLECRRVNGVPKQKTILNLGSNFDIAERDWPHVTSSVIDALRGQQRVLLEDYKIRTVVEDIVRRLRAKDYDVDAGRDDRDHIITDEVHHRDARTVGGERICLQALQQVGFMDLLRALGMRERHVRLSAALVVGRTLSPGSEAHTYDWMMDASSILELLELEDDPPCNSTLYRVGDRLWDLREQLMDGLYGNAKEMFGFRETILFYDLTNTFYTGRKQGELLRYGRSKEKRTDCPLVTLALTLDASGFPRTVEILPGNASEPDTLKQAIEKLDGACPTVIMDAGIATAANIAYLKEQRLDWICVARTRTPAAPERDADVDTNGDRPVRAWQLFNQEGELRVYVHSAARKATGDRMLENRRAKFEAAIEKLHAGLSKPNCMKDYTKVQVKVGRLQEKHKRVSYQYKVRVLKKPDSTHAKAVTYTHQPAYDTQTKASGGYILRTSHTDWSIERVVRTYWRLAEIERTFRSLKSELGLRPIYHRKDARIEAHIFLSVLAYHAVHLIRTKLKQYNIHDSWATLQFELNQWRRITTVLPETRDRCILLRQDTDLPSFRRQIALIMGLKPHRYTKKERTHRPHKSVVT